MTSERRELLRRCQGAFCGDYVDLRAENERLQGIAETHLRCTERLLDATVDLDDARADVERLRMALGELDWLTSSPGDMRSEEMRTEARRIIRAALDEGSR